MGKFLLVVPNLRYNSDNFLWSILPSRGLLSLAAVLRNAGNEVQYIDADIDNLSELDIICQIMSFKPDVVGITMNTFQAKSGYSLAKTIKGYDPGISILIGGPHPSALKEEILKDIKCIDIIAVGEAEKTIEEISDVYANKKTLNDVKGIVYRERDGSIKTTADQPLIEDLDTIPFPAYDLAGNLRRYPGAHPLRQSPSMHIMASRGCPFDCIFCTKSVWGKRTRFRSPENIISEVEYVHKNLGINEIFFQDDTMNLNRNWFYKVCDLIIERGLDKLSYKAPFRVNAKLVDEELLAKAKRAGFWIIFYGVESGNQEILDKVKKGTTIEEIKRAFRLTQDAGIRTIAAFMVGNFGENHSTINDSIALAKELRPDSWGFSIATPLPGTEFHDIAR